MPKFTIKLIFLLGVVFIIGNLHAGHSRASTSLATWDGQSTDSCEEVAAELARFKNTLITWGASLKGDSQSSITSSSAEGEYLTDSVTLYKSKSRFNKHVRQLNEDREGVIERTPLLDEKGKQIGLRMVKETSALGKVTEVRILLATDRKVQVIIAPSLKLALAVEKGNRCQAEAARRLTTHAGN
jgi:hypothetical protein